MDPPGSQLLVVTFLPSAAISARPHTTGVMDATAAASATSGSHDTAGSGGVARGDLTVA